MPVRNPLYLKKFPAPPLHSAVVHLNILYLPNKNLSAYQSSTARQIIATKFPKTCISSNSYNHSGNKLVYKLGGQLYKNCIWNKSINGKDTFLNNKYDNPIHISANGFNTRRSNTLRRNREERSASETSKENKVEENQTISEEEYIRLAFAEGYAAAEREGKPSERSQSILRRMLRVFLFSFSLTLGYVILMGFNAIKGKINTGGVNVSSEDTGVTFDDVKGADEAKQELKDIVEFLQDPGKFESIGAKLPKGILLVGSPGIGKTLLARAVAGEAGVPFFYSSGSDFDDMFVGMGAKKVRKLFKMAKNNSPCIIFIDEIDSVGSKRTESNIHPYANQTINQLLSEMDGYAPNEGVIVLGATNRRHTLDKALLRPGRFDTEVYISPPDIKGRQEIFEHYLSKIKVNPNVDPKTLAMGTMGFTGADIENMVNQAALQAVLDGTDCVQASHLEDAKDKIIMGPAKTHRIPDKETNRCTAVHEAGHTLVAYYTEDATPLHKVTIIPRGSSLGHTSFMPDKDQYGLTKSQLMAQMDVSMGGRVAEEIMFGADKVSTGASNDFEQATSIATAIVKKYGMSEKVGVRVFDAEMVPTLYGTTVPTSTQTSYATAQLLDEEIKRYLNESFRRAKDILQKHSKELQVLSEELNLKETLDASEVKKIIENKKYKIS